MSRAVADVYATLAHSADAEQTLTEIASLLVPTVADWCTVDLAEPNGSIWRIGQAGLAETRADAETRANSELALDVVARRVVEAARPLLLQTPTQSRAAADADEAAHLLRDLGSTSLLALPLLVRGTVIGAVSLGQRGRRRALPARDVGVLEDLAHRVALAVDNARLLREAQSMRERAGRVVDRLRRLEGLTAALTAALTPDQVARVMVDLGVQAFGASACVLMVARDEEHVLELARVVGYSEDDTRSWHRIPLDAPAPLAEAARTGAPVWIESAETRVTRYPGLGPTSGRHAAWASVPMVTEGRVVGVLGLSFREARSHDDGEWELLRAVAQQGALALERAALYEATEQAHAAARDALQIRDAFLSIAAHELRTPITGLRAFASMLQRQIQDPDAVDRAAVHRSLSAIDRQSAKLSALVSQLLDVAQLEGGQLRLTRTLADVGALIRDAAEHQRVIVPRHTLTVTAPEPIVANVDPLRLEQVLANLVGNAAKFSPPDTEIEIDVTRDGAWVRICVRDHGPGVAPEIVARVFERYARHGGRDNLSGLGLGLFITREIAWLHGGTVAVEDADGGGARFIVRLPLARYA